MSKVNAKLMRKFPALLARPLERLYQEDEKLEIKT